MFFERAEGGERALAVHIHFGGNFHRDQGVNSIAGDQDNEDLEEFLLLISASGATVFETLTGKRNQIHPKTFVGSGKLDEIAQMVKLHEIDIVLFNHTLSPSQERNLEEVLECRVLDRTGLILDIFAQRARSFEGKLQVELAQLKHLSSRLVRGWTHLERQKGGIGMRGPGESQLETDRRLIQVRMNNLQRRLEKVNRQRQQGRRSRERSAIPTISLVGYTNAGKSTLFNALTKADVLAKDMLFATLDPTFRRVRLPQVGEAVFADTVGFIRHLPHDLVEAFSATLQESKQADMLLHVVDASSPDSYQNIQDVDEVLKQINADEVPTLLVYNKIDRLAEGGVRVDYNEAGEPWRVWVSAQQNLGLDALLDVITTRLNHDMFCETVTLQPDQGRFRAWCFKQKAVIKEELSEQGESLLSLSLPLEDFKQAMKANDLNLQQLGLDPDLWKEKAPWVK